MLAATSSSAAAPAPSPTEAGAQASEPAPDVAMRAGGAGMAWQWLLSYGFGRAFDATIGPWMRQGVEGMLGRPHTPAYIPPTTWGFLARDLAIGGTGFVLGDQVFRAISRWPALGGSLHGAANQLTTSGGLAGAQAQLGGAMTLTAFRNLAGRSLIMSLLFTGIDATFANAVGPRVESTVNRLTGHRGSTSKTNADGTIPQSLQKVGIEQLSRNLARNTLGSITYSATLATVGAQTARAIALAVPGSGGALLGALGSALLASAVSGGVDVLVGARLADMAQLGVRRVARLAGRALAATRPGDVVPVPGDRISGSVKGVLVPFATAAATGQRRAFVHSIAPTGSVA